MCWGKTDGVPAVQRRTYSWVSFLNLTQELDSPLENLCCRHITMRQRNRSYCLLTRALDFVFVYIASNFFLFPRLRTCSFKAARFADVFGVKCLQTFYKNSLVYIFMRSKSQDLNIACYPASSQGISNINIFGSRFAWIEGPSNGVQEKFDLGRKWGAANRIIIKCVDRVCRHNGIIATLLQVYCYLSYGKSYRWGSNI